MMWIAQNPCGTWCAYRSRPVEKMSGWDGDVYSVLMRDLWILSWRETLEEMSFKSYQDRFRGKELTR